MSLGAGVDTLMAPGLIPQHLPIARIVSDSHRLGWTLV